MTHLGFTKDALKYILSVFMYEKKTLASNRNSLKIMDFDENLIQWSYHKQLHIAHSTVGS